MQFEASDREMRTGNCSLWDLFVQDRQSMTVKVGFSFGGGGLN